MLPLGRFPVLNSGGCEVTFASIRTRHPGSHAFRPRGPEAAWRINVNVLGLERGSIVATQSSAFSVANVGDSLVRVCLPLSGSGEFRTAKKRRALSAASSVISPSSEFECYFDDAFRGLIATFPRNVVEEAITCFSGQQGAANQIDSAYEAGASLDLVRRQVLALVRAVDNAPEQILHEQRFRRAHEELVLLHLASSLASTGEAGDVSPSAIYLARAMDFIHAHTLDDIGPAEIALAAGCSLRNLQLLFAREFGETITRTLRRMRLEEARRRLLRPDKDVTITGVAVDCGFYHLSDFARHYRREFGENPSQTLVTARSR